MSVFCAPLIGRIRTEHFHLSLRTASDCETSGPRGQTLWSSVSGVHPPPSPMPPPPATPPTPPLRVGGSLQPRFLRLSPPQMWASLRRRGAFILLRSGLKRSQVRHEPPPSPPHRGNSQAVQKAAAFPLRDAQRSCGFRR